jgi:hypothetical protein
MYRCLSYFVLKAARGRVGVKEKVVEVELAAVARPDRKDDCGAGEHNASWSALNPRPQKVAAHRSGDRAIWSPMYAKVS